MKNKFNLINILLVILTAVVIYNYFVVVPSHKVVEVKLSYTEFLDRVNKNEITKVSINSTGNLIKAEDKNKNIFLIAVIPGDSTLIPTLKNKNIDLSTPYPQTDSVFTKYLVWAAILFFIFIIFRVLQGGKGAQGDQSGGGMGGNPFSFGRSKARLVKPEDSNVTFSDVAGVDEAKEDLEELVDFLKSPQKFQKLGAKIPKGCLLIGPPGTGKTLLAKAIAGEARVPFFSVSGSDFVEMFVGVGASRVRDLFNQAKKHAPCIIFIDEIDAVGRQRGVGVGGGNDEREQTLNQLLVEMDGFTTNTNIIIIAATNRSDVLDNALLRPGRFDRQVVVSLPDIVGRERILQIYLNKIPLAKDVNVNVLARGTTGFSGADLANLVNEAALFSARKDKKAVDAEDFEQARDKIMMGAERKTSRMSDKEKTNTAYHEAGHALVAFKVADFYPVHKVTIIPRGRSLGVTAFLPERDEYSKSYTQLTSQLAVLFGGRMAEELIFGKESITTGASMDIQMATNIAKKMITEWGFSDKVGRVKYTDDNPYQVGKAMSEETAKEIEDEVKYLISEAEQKARSILTTYSKAHKELTHALLEYETLTGEEAKRVCNGESIDDIRASLSGLENNESSSPSSVPVSG